MSSEIRYALNTGLPPPASNIKVLRVCGIGDAEPVGAERSVRIAILRRLCRNDAERSLLGYIHVVPGFETPHDRARRWAALVEFHCRLPHVVHERSQKQTALYIRVSPQGSPLLSVDNFDCLTQLYRTPSVHEAALDIVAITGLGCNPYEAWQNDNKLQEMWLQHWLAKDAPDCRSLIYGWRQPRTKTFRAFALHFLDDLVRSRPEDQHRPLVFVTHSIGAVILIHVRLTDSPCYIPTSKKSERLRKQMIHIMKQSSNSSARQMYRDIRRIILFGLPELTVDLEDLAPDLALHAGHLDAMKGALSGLMIMSIQETDQTRRLQKDANGRWVRTGPKFTSTQASNFWLGHFAKSYHTVDAEHWSMIKLADRQGSAYQHVLHFINAGRNEDAA